MYILAYNIYTMTSAFVRHVCAVPSRTGIPQAHRFLAPYTFSPAAVQEAYTMHRPIKI